MVSDTRDIWRIHVEDMDDATPLDVANVLSAERGVDFVEPNALQAATYAAEPQPSDSLWQNRWCLITTGSSRIHVVVHENGVDINYPDLIANIDPGQDFDNDDDRASNNDGPHNTAWDSVDCERAQ